jgi:hypothetical protein
MYKYKQSSRNVSDMTGKMWADFVIGLTQDWYFAIEN